MTSRLIYVELKSGHSHNGPAWIGRGEYSRSGRTVYFNGLTLKRAVGGGIEGNHYDPASGEEYWVSGVKKNGDDRHRLGRGKIVIDARAVAEYLSIAGAEALDSKRFEVRDEFVETDRALNHARENLELGQTLENNDA